jgi:dipeptidyl aminopeptidase/acylaminoacyl peptidase
VKSLRHHALWVPVAVFLLIRTGSGQAIEDGRLIDATAVTLQPEIIQRLEKIWPGSKSALSQVELEMITYYSDGLRVKGYLAKPKKATKLPCVIFNRGGNREFGALNDFQAALMLGRIASWGYVVVASQYRGNAGGEGREEFGGKDVDDVLNLFPLLQSLPEADARRIGMYGWSRGGTMTYQALVRTDKVAAAIVGAGITDQFDAVKRRPEMERSVLSELIPNYAANKETELRARSVLFWPEKLHHDTPILILHGSADWRVHPSQSLRLVQKLYELKHPVRFVFFEGGDHGLSEHRAEVNRIVRDWLDRYVRDGKPWPSLEPHGQ